MGLGLCWDCFVCIIGLQFSFDDVRFCIGSEVSPSSPSSSSVACVPCPFRFLTLSFAAYCHTATCSHTHKDRWARLADGKRLSPVFCEASSYEKKMRMGFANLQNQHAGHPYFRLCLVKNRMGQLECNLVLFPRHSNFGCF